MMNLTTMSHNNILISEFATFATDAHSGQFRKGNTSIPYVSHCFEVQKLIARCGVVDLATHCAALAHDVHEDTQEAIENNFCKDDEIIKDIINLVSILTQEKHVSKEEYMNRFATCDIRAFHIKCADRICNVRDFYNDGNEKYAAKYFNQANILWGRLRSCKDDVSDKLCVELNKLIEEIFT